MPTRFAAAFTMCQIALGVIPSPQIFPSRLTRRKIAPPLIAAAVVHSSTARFAHFGTGTVRMAFLCQSGQRLPNAPREPENLPFRVQPVRLVVVRIQ
jgi:hypothetical protein